MPELSQGQKLAVEQLGEISGLANGALEVIGAPEASSVQGYVWLNISLETGGYRTEKGFAFRERERLRIHLHPDFPFKRPSLYFAHKRFAGHAHIQWGAYICLYQSPEVEYEPSDGMFGFFDRVRMWMCAAGAGELDPNDAPLHPPVAYPTSQTTFLARANAPDDAGRSPLWVGRADLRKVRNGRFDILGWTKLSDWGTEDVDHPIAAAIFFDKPLASEYPSKVNDLITLVEDAGLSFDLLYSLLRLFSLVGPEGEPAYFVLGAPMRRKAGNAPLRPHLTVWEIDPGTLDALRAIIRSKGGDGTARSDLVNWMVRASVKWCDVMEDRPEIVERRDGGTLMADLARKRVLLLGCGALGSSIAETVVRSGVSRLHLVDKGTVNPGILVRQRFCDADIGLAKAMALKARVQTIGLEAVVTAEESDLARAALDRFDQSEWDIIIEATASSSVAHRIERELKKRELSIPLLSLTVSASAENGSVAVKMPGYRTGALSIARQAKLEAFARDADHSLVKAFWPARDGIELFQPEPGCSEPTFVGSAADIDHHAAGLLNVGLLRVRSLTAKQASMDLFAAPWLANSTDERRQLGYTFNDIPAQEERRYRYAVLRSEAAAKGIAAELKRIARTRSDKVETGGLMFGEIDDAHGHIWIDSVSGPPSDSKASAEQFLCGVAGTKELNAFRSKASGGSSRFVGIWHTHPISPGRPSEDDLNAMVKLLLLQDATPRHVVMLIVGHAATKPSENYYLYRRNEFQLIAVDESELGGAK